MAQASVDLLGAPTKEFPAGKKALADRIAALRGFLTQNPPPSTKLVPPGRDFGGGGNAAGGEPRRPGSGDGGPPPWTLALGPGSRPPSCSRSRRSATITTSTRRSSAISMRAAG